MNNHFNEIFIRNDTSIKQENIQILLKIGSGGFGTVYKVKDISTSKIYAMKKICLNTLTLIQQKKALREALTQSKIDHQNIIKCYTSFLENEFLDIIMEYAPHGDLLSVFL